MATSKLLEILILNTPGNVYMKNTNGQYMICNQNQLHLVGFSKVDDIINKTDYDLYELDVAQKLFTTDKEIIKNKKEVVFEEDGVDKYGKPAIYLTKKTPILNKQGAVTALIGISIDITKEKQAEKAKADFIANINHDLRTHSSMVVSMASFLQDFSKQYPKLKDYFDLLANSSQQMYTINEAILNSSYSTTKKFHIETFCISEEISKIHDLIGPSLFLKQLNFVTNSFEKQKTISTDRLLFNYILRELVTNAINFTERGTISISISQNDTHVLIRIKDTGLGIPKDKLACIFESFTKLRRSNRDAEEFKGLGVGLSRAKQYALLLGGNIMVDSLINQGSIFTLSLPHCYQVAS